MSRAGFASRPRTIKMTLTVMIDLLLHARFTIPSRGILANVLEIFRNLVHLVALEISHYDIYLVAATVVHAAEEHKFRELR